MASDLFTSWQIDGETMETLIDFIFLGSKSLQMVTAAMKLKKLLLLRRKAMANLLLLSHVSHVRLWAAP